MSSLPSLLSLKGRRGSCPGGSRATSTCLPTSEKVVTPGLEVPLYLLSVRSPKKRTSGSPGPGTFRVLTSEGLLKPPSPPYPESLPWLFILMILERSFFYSSNTNMLRLNTLDHFRKSKSYHVSLLTPEISVSDTP